MTIGSVIGEFIFLLLFVVLICGLGVVIAVLDFVFTLLGFLVRRIFK